MRYTKEPVTIEAVRFIGLTDFGDPQFDVADGMPDWLMEAMSGPEHSTGSMWSAPGQAFIGEGDPPKELFIGTMEGQHIASAGDWIIQGIKGELYPCKPDIFEASYDALSGPKGAQAEILPEFTQAAKDAERSLLLDMQMAAMCQKAIDCRPATSDPDCPKLEALDASGREAVAEAMDRAGEVTDAKPASREPAPFVIGEGFL